MRARLCFALGLAAVAASGGAATPARQTVDMGVGPAPQPVPTAAGRRLAYELHVTNFSQRPLRMDRLQILGPDDAILMTLDGGALVAALGHVADTTGAGLASGQRAILYVDLVAVSAPPAQLRHRLTITPGGSDSTATTVLGGPVTVADRAVISLGPPLQGGPWAAVYAPEAEFGHRRVFYATEGKAVLPGRFAIDFMRVDAAGSRVAGDADRPGDYLGFGAPVLAVADGVVVAVRDDVPDPLRVEGRAQPAIGDASGNYVALDIGGGRIVFYEHLKHGIPVRSGLRVRRGAVIGALGFTGSASEPHLHFHVADGTSLLGAEGQPFVFERFEQLGGFASLDAFGRSERWQPDAALRQGVMPQPNIVLRFPETAL